MDVNMNIGNGILAVGSGRVFLLHTDKLGNVTVETVVCPKIAVSTTGVVVFDQGDGVLHVMGGVEVEIGEVEFSVFGLAVTAAAEPTCRTCYDSDTEVAAMIPPVCPKCNRGSSSGPRRNEH